MRCPPAAPKARRPASPASLTRVSIRGQRRPRSSWLTSVRWTSALRPTSSCDSPAASRWRARFSPNIRATLTRHPIGGSGRRLGSAGACCRAGRSSHSCQRKHQDGPFSHFIVGLRIRLHRNSVSGAGRGIVSAMPRRSVFGPGEARARGSRDLEPFQTDPLPAAS